MTVFVVSIDGPDFSGKTTVANLVTELLRGKVRGMVVKRTELPSNLVTGTFTHILRNSAERISPAVFALLYAQDHLNHYEKFIKPLKESKERFLVIQERSFLSTYIYQGVLGKLDFKWIDEINKFNKNIPDLTIILKIDLEEIMNRKRIDNREFDKFEAPNHLKKQFEIYYKIPSNLVKKFNIKYTDANKDAMSIAKDCTDMILKELKE